jgi:hypothetical protein
MGLVAGIMAGRVAGGVPPRRSQPRRWRRSPRSIDVHHVRTVLSQEFGEQRPGHVVTEVNDTNPVQRARHLFPPLPSACMRRRSHHGVAHPRYEGARQKSAIRAGVSADRGVRSAPGEACVPARGSSPTERLAADRCRRRFREGCTKGKRLRRLDDVDSVLGAEFGSEGSGGDLGAGSVLAASWRQCNPSIRVRMLALRV